jgi:DNA-binding MarR family transcriptional regulator
MGDRPDNQQFDKGIDMCWSRAMERGAGPAPYQPATGYTAWLLKRAERRAAASMYDELRGLGLTPAQFGVLAALVRLQRASLAELARSQFVSPQAMTGLVAALERQGYIDRDARASARVVHASLTRRGRQVFEEATRRVTAVEAAMTAGLTEAAVARLDELLGRCVQAFPTRP